MAALHPTPRSSRRPLIWIVAVLLLAVTGLLAPGLLEANTKDSDGSRMQARKITFPSTHQDSLDPPDDRADWRYFKLTEQTSLTIKATLADSEAGAKLRLMDAGGDELAGASARNGEAALSKQVDAGVYYISIEAASKTDYSLSLRE
ncbi:MAG: hypothetical protein ACOC9J_00815 [Persicimonas sp.]